MLICHRKLDYFCCTQCSSCASVRNIWKKSYHFIYPKGTNEIEAGGIENMIMEYCFYLKHSIEISKCDCVPLKDLKNNCNCKDFLT